MASESTYTPLLMAKELYMLQNNGKRKRGRKPVFSASQFYPWKVELEMKEFIASMLRENGKLLKELALLGYQADGLDDVNDADVFTPSNIDEKAGDFFREVSDFSSRKMDDFSEKTVGRTIGYIPNQSKLRDDFVNNFVANCKSAAEDQKKEIAAAVYKHRMFPNEDSGSLVKEINSINTKYTKNKSKFIARNETGNLNGAIQRTQMEGAGFRYYKWMCMLDGVTRDTHRSMNGLVCKWEDDTVYSDDGGKTWKKRTGSMFIGQPGQDYNCRCTAIPFDPELEDDYEVKEMPEEKPEEKEPTPLEKAREEAKAAEERAEKAEGIAKSLKKENERYYDSLVAMRETASVNFVKAEFPNETWIKENGFSISLSRIKEAEPGNEPEKLIKEKYLSEKIAKKGHSVWLIPEKKDMKKGGNRPDAVIDGSLAELKLVTGKIDKIWTRLNKASLQSKVAYIGTTKEYNVSRVASMIRGKFMQALSDDSSYKYPFRFTHFSFVDSNGEIHNIDVMKIWESIKN
jgi:SPP1 gp7 family putative phage head morphogenesis protein